MMEIETPRLLLRPPKPEDFSAFVDLYRDPIATRFLNGPAPSAVVWRIFTTIAGSWWLNGYGYFSVVEKASSRWIGRVGPWFPEGWPGTEVGWAFLTEKTGQGFAQEAAAATIDWAFEHLAWERIVHCIDPNNEASAELAKRLGSVEVGTVKMPHPFDGKDNVLFAQNRQDWLARKQTASVDDNIPQGAR